MLWWCFLELVYLSVVGFNPGWRVNVNNNSVILHFSWSLIKSQKFIVVLLYSAPLIGLIVQNHFLSSRQGN